MGPMPFLATAFSEGASVSWWQSLGGLMAVLALLVVFLKLLGRVNRRMSGDQASIVKVWPLGPRREIQVLRLGEEVHFIYRHDGAMVLLQQQPYADFVREHAPDKGENPPRGWQRFLPGSFDLRALKPTSRSENASGILS